MQDNLRLRSSGDFSISLYLPNLGIDKDISLHNFMKQPPDMSYKKSYF